MPFILDFLVPLLVHTALISAPVLAGEQGVFSTVHDSLYARILDCEADPACGATHICKMEISVSFEDWTRQSQPMKGILSWTHGTNSDSFKDFNDWASLKQITFPVDIAWSGRGASHFQIQGRTSFPMNQRRLTIDDIAVGRTSTGILDRQPGKFLCRRFNDPK